MDLIYAPMQGSAENCMGPKSRSLQYYFPPHLINAATLPFKMKCLLSNHRKTLYNEEAHL